MIDLGLGLYVRFVTSKVTNYLSLSSSLLFILWLFPYQVIQAEWWNTENQVTFSVLHTESDKGWEMNHIWLVYFTFSWWFDGLAGVAGSKCMEATPARKLAEWKQGDLTKGEW